MRLQSQKVPLPEPLSITPRRAGELKGVRYIFCGEKYMTHLQ